MKLKILVSAFGRSTSVGNANHIELLKQLVKAALEVLYTQNKKNLWNVFLYTLQRLFGSLTESILGTPFHFREYYATSTSVVDTWQNSFGIAALEAFILHVGVALVETDL